MRNEIRCSSQSPFPIAHSALLALSCIRVASPGTAQAQQIREVQVHALAAVFADRLLGGGVGFALRPPGRVRLALTATAGDLRGALAGRGEALVSFHVDPERRVGPAPYAAAGLAANVTRRAIRGYVELLLGLEASPGRSSGWFLEAGVGGGMRVAMGYRIRHRVPPHRP